MNSLINLYVNTSGIWKKIAAFLPLLIGIATLLSGLAGFCTEFGSAKNIMDILAVVKNIQTDPNMGLILAGLGALGVHFNHANTVATLADHSEAIADNSINKK